MPLPSYTRLHPDAAVAPAQLRVLKNWLNPPEAPAAALESDLAADDAQYEKWIGDRGSTRATAPAPNGIGFPSGYRNWKMVSATDRFDNGTIRGAVDLLGNDTAVDAIATNRINPWPDGAMLAKVAWFGRDDGKGRVRAGAFFQVEFMLRDRKKYAATKGWGWARWRGLPA